MLRYFLTVAKEQSFTKADEKQLAEYVEEERALHKGIKRRSWALPFLTEVVIVLP